MLIDVLNIIIAAIIVTIVCYNIIKGYKKYKNCTRQKMSFADSLSLCDLPVVCFKCSGKNFNLLVDSGANNNLVDSNILDQFEFEESEYYASMQGIEGNKIKIPMINMTIEYKGEKYTDRFQVADVSKLFGGMKEEKGVTIHGLLGNNFFQKYKYILNFDELTFYHV